MQYKGFFNPVNAKPQGDWIEVFCSDWNKDHWAFYAYIGVDSYERDTKEISDLVEKLNWRDGDTYIELINHSANERAKDLYEKMMKKSDMSDWAALDPNVWKELVAPALWRFT